MEIKLLLLDVDGVQTDGSLLYSDSGEKIKAFNARDGVGIKRAIALGVEVGIISHSLDSKLIKNRCKTLGISKLYLGLEDKAIVYERWLAEDHISPSETAYIGDDVNDLSIMNRVGITACPSDAVDLVKSKADYTLKTAGGKGVVREFVNRFIQSDEDWAKSIS